MDETCCWCGEPIGPDDRFVTPKIPEGVFHHVCATRIVVRSLGHQLGICACNHGPNLMDDPPGLTRREAARTAAAHYETTIRAAARKLFNKQEGHR